MRLAGRARLRAACLTSLLLVAACGGSDNGPTSPSCANIAGTWDAAFANSCGYSATGVVVVAQSGCNFSAVIPGQGTVEGRGNGNSATFTPAHAILQPGLRGRARDRRGVPLRGLGGTLWDFCSGLSWAP